jgi:serine/threonine protein kinase
MFSLMLRAAVLLAFVAVASSLRDASPVLGKGDRFECMENGKNTIIFTLGDELGIGQFGAVFKTLDGKYAVKVQRPITKKMAWFVKPGLSNECGVMRHLEAHGLANVPRCHALCRKDDKDIMVMDLVNGATLDEAEERDKFWTDQGSKRVGEELYHTAIGMLRAGVVNTDQSSQNIMTSSNGSIYLIDFGMAVLKSHFMSECKQLHSSQDLISKRARLLSKYESHYGRAALCEVEWRALQEQTLGTMIYSLGASCEDESSLYEAFCKDQALEILRYGAESPPIIIPITQQYRAEENKRNFLEGSKSSGFYWHRDPDLILRPRDLMWLWHEQWKKEMPNGAELVGVDWGNSTDYDKDSFPPTVEEILTNGQRLLFRPPQDESLVPDSVRYGLAGCNQWYTKGGPAKYNRLREWEELSCAAPTYAKTRYFPPSS